MTDFDAARNAIAGLRDHGARTRYDEATRRALLVVHGAFGITIASCFAVYGVPIGWRTSLGEDPTILLAITVTPAAGALALLAGLLPRRRPLLILEAIGMAIMLAWEVTGVVVVLRWISLADPGPLQYQVALYAMPAALMVVHLVTLGLYIRDRRRQGRQ